MFAGAHLLGALMRGTVAHLPHLTDLAALRERQSVLHLRPPSDGPVHHQPFAGGIGGLQ